mgnify:CR=1 FL=1
MFGLDEPATAEDEAPPQATQFAEWQERVLLSNEKEALGLYLTGHPFDAVRNDARYFSEGKLADIVAEPPPGAAGARRGEARPAV